MPTDDEYLTAKAYLQFLRAPEEFIDSVDEQSWMTGSEVERAIQIRLRPHSGAQSLLIDIQHPAKGTISDSRFDTISATVETINHEDHLAISQYLIWFRFMSVWRTARVPRRAAAAFGDAMLHAQEQLMQIPVKTSAKAREIFEDHFVAGSSILTPMLAVPGITVDAVKLDRLRGLCERLCDRYLLLLRVTPTSTGQTAVTFTQRQEVSEYAERRRKKDTTDKPRPAARHLIYGTVPIVFRLHLPWAKRTNHFSLRIDPPPGHFFYPQTLLTRTQNELPTPVERSGTGTKWSIQTLGGRHNSTFISHGTSYSGPLFLSLRTLEIPGRATSRACVMAALVTLGLFGFVFLETATRDLVIQVGTLVLPLLAVGAFATAPGPGPGILGVPLIARITAPALAVDCVLFFFFYGIGLFIIPAPAEKTAPSFLLSSPLWYGLLDLLFPILALSLFVLLTIRLNRLYTAFRASSRQNHDYSTDFFEE